MNNTDTRLIDILVCPICKGPLKSLRREEAGVELAPEIERELVCGPDKLAFPIKDGIVRMLVDEARVIHA